MCISIVVHVGDGVCVVGPKAPAGLNDIDRTSGLFDVMEAVVDVRVLFLSYLILLSGYSECAWGQGDSQAAAELWS